jgi:nickel transport protein
MRNTLTFLTILIISGFSTLQAHDITFDIFKSRPAVVIRACYSGAEPVSWASIAVYAPSEAKTFYQNGRTDKDGYFAFVPDAPGKWTVRIDDELGHKKNAVVAVSPDFLKGGSVLEHSSNKDRTGFSSIPLVYRALLGVLFIFGTTGFLYGMKTRTIVRD